MMDDSNPFGPAVSLPQADNPATPAGDPVPASEPDAAPAPVAAFENAPMMVLNMACALSGSATISAMTPRSIGATGLPCFQP